MSYENELPDDRAALGVRWTALLGHLFIPTDGPEHQFSEKPHHPE